MDVAGMIRRFITRRNLRRLYKARYAALRNAEDAKQRRDTRDIGKAREALKAINEECLKLEVEYG